MFQGDTPKNVAGGSDSAGTANGGACGAKERLIQREPLVLVHGLGVDHRMWTLQTQFLEKSYHVFNPDLPGFGGEPPLAPGDAPLVDRYVQWLEDEIVNKNVGKSVLVGYSMGAVLALKLALKNPELVSRICLAAGSLRWGGYFGGLLKPLAPLIAWLVKRRAERVVTGILDDERLIGIFNDMGKSSHGPTMARLVSELLALDLTGEARSLTVPVLTVNGAEDHLVGRSGVARMCSVFGAAHSVVIGGADHFFCLTHHELFTGLIDDFARGGHCHAVTGKTDSRSLE